MHIITLIIWIFSLAFLLYTPATTRPFIFGWNLGLFLFDLWIGLHFLIDTADRITF
jgi:hypothetical protein